jgi:flagellar L-ring protein FlgH
MKRAGQLPSLAEANAAAEAKSLDDSLRPPFGPSLRDVLRATRLSRLDGSAGQRRARRQRCALACAALLALSGCATVVGDVRPFAPAASPAPAPAGAATTPPAPGGSIYANAAGNRGLRLFQDNKAREVGDLLTVVLVENTRAKTNAKTAVSKDSTLDLAAPTIFGQGVTYNGKPLLQAEVEGKRKFDGAGDSAQSNQLAGDITVSVVEDLGNGNLRVAGDKRLRLNQGDELVQVQGIVRIADIGPDNRITSDRVGEARIVYGGRGTLARSNAMGWLARFFNSAAFPY